MGRLAAATTQRECLANGNPDIAAAFAGALPALQLDALGSHSSRSLHLDLIHPARGGPSTASPSARLCAIYSPTRLRRRGRRRNASGSRRATGHPAQSGACQTAVAPADRRRNDIAGQAVALSRSGARTKKSARSSSRSGAWRRFRRRTPRFRRSRPGADGAGNDNYGKSSEATAAEKAPGRIGRWSRTRCTCSRRCLQSSTSAGAETQRCARGLDCRRCRCKSAPAGRLPARACRLDPGSP